MRLMAGVITFMMALLAMCAGGARAADYTFVLPVPTGAVAEAGGESGDPGGDASKFLAQVCEILSEKTGDNIECAVTQKPNDATLTRENIDAFLGRLEDMDYSAVYLSSNDFYRIARSGYEELTPALSISFFDKNYDQVCLYTLKEEEIVDIEELRGRRWGGSYFYMPTRYLLYRNGIDETLGDFFGKMDYVAVDSYVPMARRLLAGEVDVFTGTVEEESVGKMKDKEFGRIEGKFCVKHRATHLIAFHQSMPREKMQQLRHILLHAHRDKDFRPFWFIFTAIEGHFVPFDSEAFSLTTEYVDTCNERGWLDEHLDFITKNTSPGAGDAAGSD